MSNDELARQRRMKVVEIAKRYAVNIKNAPYPIHEDKGKGNDNRGKSLEPLRICKGWRPGLAWCAAFITLVVTKTCESLPGSISQYWQNSAASNGVKPEGKICTITDNEMAKQIKSGMILCKGASGSGHVILAVKDYNPRTRELEIIAGNTSVKMGNAALDRNGGNCVYKAYPLTTLINEGYRLYKIWEETDIKPVEQTTIVSGTSGTSSNSSGNNDYAGSTESQQAQLDYSGLMYDENAVSTTSDISKKEANEKNTSPTTNDGKSVFCKSENSTDLNDVIAKQITNPNIIMEDIS
jgi:hypothetical protein